ncbi:MAG TPA: hemerythrin domain-containing protein [Alphaproteobacteria bacterium]
MSRAIDLIHGEHRDIALVVNCFASVLRETREGILAPDPELYEAVIDYMQNFPDRFHHPKEEDYLFKMLRTRDPSAGKLLDELHDQHVVGERSIADLRWKLEALKKDPDGAFPAFDRAAIAYIDFQRQHMAVEEQEVIPRAQAALTEADWAAIERAFADNDDPIFGRHPRAYFDRLFSRIVNLAPEPYGVGERKAPLKAHERSTARRAAVGLHWN